MAFKRKTDQGPRITQQPRWNRLISVIWNNASKPIRLLLLLWIFVPVATIIAFIPSISTHNRVIFAVTYIAIIPCASTLDLAGQELSRLLPRVAGIAIETLLATAVEMVLLIILIARPNEHGNAVTVVKAVILGSILANTLLCLGLCLVVGGIKYDQQQKFHPFVGGSSSNMLLGSCVALLLPAVFFSALYSTATSNQSAYSLQSLSNDTLAYSRATSVVLLIAFGVHVHHNVKARRTKLDQVLKAEEEKEEEQEEGSTISNDRFTLVEACVLALVSLAFVCVLAFILVREIHPIVVSGHISENFMGLIIVPLVEKMSEHVTAVNKVLKNQSNMAILHCIGPSISTALFNTPVVVFVGWGLGKSMDLNFEVFQIVSVMLAILVVIHFLSDGESNSLRGATLILTYVVLAIGAWYYPSITVSSQNEGNGQQR